MFTPSHWSQLGQRKRQPTVSGPSAPGRKIIAGKALPQKKEQKRDRANYCRLTACWLRDALCESAAELNDLWNKRAISNEIAVLTSNIFGIACKTIDDSLKPKHVGAPRTLAKAKNLVKEMERFRVAIESAVTHEKRHALELACCLHEFCCDIVHYELQIRFAHGIVDFDAQGQPKLTNRPTNIQGKNEFAKVVHKHQAVHGANTFPKTRHIKAALASVNQSVPDRTLREWRRQMQLNTFGHYIQPRKRQ
jgi:adenylate kinase family enzyme